MLRLVAKLMPTLIIWPLIEPAAAAAPQAMSGSSTPEAQTNGSESLRGLPAEDLLPEDTPQPNPGVVIEQPQPSGMPLDRALRTTAIGATFGLAALFCPANETRCETQPGPFFALLILERPRPWFAWGGSLEGLMLSQSWRDQEHVLSLSHSALSGRLSARLHPISAFRVDPYFGIGLGVGFIASSLSTHAATLHADGGGATESSGTWTPFYAVGIGVDLEMTDRVKVGAVIDWSNFGALTGERCPWKAFQMCTSSSWGAFSPDNSVWKLGAALSFAFGPEL